MKRLSCLLALAALAAASPALADYICGNNVNVRGPLQGGYAPVIGSARYGEYVTRTGQSYNAYVGGRWHRFERLYFYEEPRGYGYVASQYICSGGNEPYPDDPYPNDPYPNDPYPNDPYPNDPYPEDPYPDDPYDPYDGTWRPIMPDNAGRP